MPNLSAASRWLLTLFVIMAVAPAKAQSARYTLDPAHSRIVFSVGHDGFSHTIGTFSRIQGELWFDPQDWSSARLDVWIELDTLDLGDEGFTKRIARRDFLSVNRHPRAHFVSSKVESLSTNTAHVHGLLTLRGKTAPVTLEVKLNRLARSAYSLRHTAGFSATASLSRSAFGMTSHAKAVDDTVQLRIEVEALRARRRDEPERSLPAP